jgi:hypothetical protein
MNIEKALIARIDPELIRVVGDIDCSIRAEPERFIQNRSHDVGRDDFPRTVQPRSHDRQGTDRTASCHENAFAEQRSGAVDGMQDDREGLGKGSFVD